MADNETQKPKAAEASELSKKTPEVAGIKEGLGGLKEVMERERKDLQLTAELLEKYLEGTKYAADGKLPDTLTQKQAEEITAALTPEKIVELANMVNFVPLKNSLAALAATIPGAPKAPDVSSAKGNPFLDKTKVVIDMVASGVVPAGLDPKMQKLAETIQSLAPTIKKLEGFGISREFIASGFASFVSQLFASVGKFLPPAALAAAQIEFDKVKKDLAQEPLAPAEKEKRIAASRTPDGERNFKAAMLAWIKRGAPKNGKPGSEALLGQQVAATPAAAPAAKPGETPNTSTLGSEKQELTVSKGGADKVGASLKDGTVTLTHGKQKLSFKDVSSKGITGATLFQPTESEGGFLSLTLSDQSKVKIPATNILKVPAEKGVKLTGLNDAKQEISFDVTSENVA